MKNQTTTTVPPTSQPPRLSVAWAPFEKNLITALKKLKEDQFLVICVKRTNQFVQFVAQGAYGLRMETTSNSYLAKADQLDRKQIEKLAELGWLTPTAAPDDSTPEQDPDGSPNFYREFPKPVPLNAVAALAVRTLTEIWRAPHPGSMEYEAFDADGAAIDLPKLGLRIAQREAQTDPRKALPKQLLATLKSITGLGDLKFDDDGDIGIQTGSAGIFVRLIEDQRYVRIYSPVLIEVDESAPLLARLNDLNANETLMRFVFRNGAIHGLADVSAVPFVDDHLHQAFAHFCAIVDAMDGLLQAEFGGRTVFAETMPSTMRH